MEYLIVFLCALAWIVGVVVADLITIRWENRNLAPADRRRIRKPKSSEYIKQDELLVISNDTDDVVFGGSPAAVYDWLMINQGVNTTTYDVFNLVTAKKVRDSQFKAAYAD